MSNEWKYIVFDTPSNGDTIILFPPMVPHDLLRNALVGPIVSAGFVRYDERHKKLVCFGKSASLGVASRPVSDAVYASRLLRTGL